MPKFQTPYNYKTKPGQTFSKEENEYGYVKNEETGLQELQIIGKTNIYDKIQESKDEVDINKILARNGVRSIDELTKNTIIEMSEEINDLTTMPKTLIKAKEQEKILTRKLSEQKTKIEQIKQKAKSEQENNLKNKQKQKQIKEKWNKLTKDEQQQAISFEEFRKENE